MTRKLLVIFLALFLLAGFANAFPRKVMVEEFTNTFCGPCNSAAPGFAAFLEANVDNIAVCVVHAWWPGSGDPWYQANTGDCTDRVNYYSVNGVPHCRVDGIIDTYPGSTTGMEAAMNTRLAIESPVEMNMLAVRDGSDLNIDIEVNSADEAVSGNYRLRVAVCEITRTYNAPNGQSEWHYGMFDMAPNALGTSFSIDANSTEDFSFTVPWLSTGFPAYEADNLVVSAWIQNDSGREVIQAEMVGIAVPYDFEVTQDRSTYITDPNGSVDFEFDLFNKGLNEDTYDVTVESDIPGAWTFEYTTPDGNQSGNSSITVSSFEHYVSTISINTGDVGGEDGTVTFTFTSDNVPTAEYVMEYYVMTAPQVLLLNNDPAADYGTYYESALDMVGEGNELNHGEWATANHAFPSDVFGDVTVDAVIWYNGDSGEILEDVALAMQSYLQDGGNLFISGSTMPYRIRTYDLMDLIGAAYQTEYAYAELANGIDGDPVSDGLEFELGDGTGADNLGTPTTMIIREGGELCLQYDNISIRRAGIRSTSDTYKGLLIGFPFEAIAEEDQRNLFMDRVMSWLLDLDDVGEGNESSIPETFSIAQNYPNPFNPSTTIEFAVPEVSDVTISVIDITGREVATLLQSSISAGNHQVSWIAQDHPSGVYFYRITAVGATQSYDAVRKMILVK